MGTGSMDSPPSSASATVTASSSNAVLDTDSGDMEEMVCAKRESRRKDR